jgi:hypothetical protein
LEWLELWWRRRLCAILRAAPLRRRKPRAIDPKRQVPPKISGFHREFVFAVSNSFNKNRGDECENEISASV